VKCTIGPEALSNFYEQLGQVAHFY